MAPCLADPLKESTRMARQRKSYTLGMPKAFHAEARLRVRYAETDQMGVVYHANYLVWFEVGRVELLRSIGLEYKRLEQDFGCMIAVVGVETRYRLPARYDDEILVRTGIAAMRGPLLKMRYEIVRVEDGKVLCDGTTTHVVVSREMVKRRLPEPYEAAFQKLLAGSAREEI
jgi:acyl-CoA thioester hydrolase